MRPISVFVFCASFVCLTACSPAEPESNRIAVNASRQTGSSNVVNGATNNMPASQNDRVNSAAEPFPANSTVADSQPAADTSNAPDPGMQIPMSETKRRKFERFRSSSANVKRNTGPPPPPVAVPAPENSEFSTSLTDVVTETRTFKNHQRLLKVQKISDNKVSTLKVYLRDGKVITIPGSRIANIGQESSANILRAAGVTP